jgi:hypothetical protein
MRKLRIAVPVGLGIVFTALGAWAATWTSYFEIQNLDTVHLEDAYIVYPNGSVSNPNGCANADYYEVISTSPAATRELMNKTLLSAFLAGRKVRLSISTASCSANNRPAYAAVRVDADQ